MLWLWPIVFFLTRLLTRDIFALAHLLVLFSFRNALTRLISLNEVILVMGACSSQGERQPVRFLRCFLRPLVEHLPASVNEICRTFVGDLIVARHSLQNTAHKRNEEQNVAL